jgi:Remorin, C-terminal region
MRTEAVEKMSEKIQITRQTAEEKRAAAEACMNKQAARAAHKAQIIRQTGRVPASHGLLCCSGFF